MLTAVVAAVAQSLRLPYVAIERPGDGGRLATYGHANVAGVERWPLMYQGALVAPRRRGESSFDERDRLMLADLARQSGAAVYAEALTADLIESRQRLVAAREDERRRLRSAATSFDREPVSAAGLLLTEHRVAVLSGAATLPAARGRGLYRALVHTRWTAAQRVKARPLAVQASTMSAPVLAEVGFTKVADMILLRRPTAPRGSSNSIEAQIAV